jgi:hypothetical protein
MRPFIAIARIDRQIPDAGPGEPGETIAERQHADQRHQQRGGAAHQRVGLAHIGDLIGLRDQHGVHHL